MSMKTGSAEAAAAGGFGVGRLFSVAERTTGAAPATRRFGLACPALLVATGKRHHASSSKRDGD